MVYNEIDTAILLFPRFYPILSVIFQMLWILKERLIGSWKVQNPWRSFCRTQSERKIKTVRRQEQVFLTLKNQMPDVVRKSWLERNFWCQLEHCLGVADNQSRAARVELGKVLQRLKLRTPTNRDASDTRSRRRLGAGCWKPTAREPGSRWLPTKNHMWCRRQ